MNTSRKGKVSTWNEEKMKVRKANNKLKVKLAKMADKTSIELKAWSRSMKAQQRNYKGAKFESVELKGVDWFAAPELKLVFTFLIKKTSFTISIPFEIKVNSKLTVWERKMKTLENVNETIGWFRTYLRPQNFIEEFQKYL